MHTLVFRSRLSMEAPPVGRLSDSRLDFRVETAMPSGQRSAARVPVPGIASLLLLATLGVGGFWAYRTTTTPAPVNGSLRLESDPVGAAVEIDGSLRGLTPVTLTLAPGTYSIVLTLDGRKQTIAAKVDKGIEQVHHIAMTGSAPAPAAAAGGRLQVTSDPPGATVSVDGVQRGVAPVSLDGLAAGDHEVVTLHLGRTQRRTVTVDPGATASLVVASVAAPAAESGWFAPRAATPLQIFDRGRLIGSTETERIMLPAGTYTLEFAADELGFRARRTVTITAGQTTTASVALPQASVNVNAVPWAEVAIDGKAFGETPIANLLVPIGTHRVTLRHPQYGEKQTTVTVSLKEPARVAVDMRVR